MVTAAAADFVESALETAVTVTVAGLGTAAGAVYRPAVVIVPTMAFPLAVPFTFQTTVVLLEFRTVAPNGWLSAIARVAEVGTTATLMAAGASCAPTAA